MTQNDREAHRLFAEAYRTKKKFCRNCGNRYWTTEDYRFCPTCQQKARGVGANLEFRLSPRRITDEIE